MSLSAAGQPGLALNDPAIALTRDSSAPLLWRFDPITEPATLVVPWFGIGEGAGLANEDWRTVLSIYTDEFGEGELVLELRYNPAQGAAELRRPDPLTPTSVTPRRGPTAREPYEAARVEGLSLEPGRHFCAVAAFDPDAQTLTLHVLQQGTPGIAGSATIAGYTEVPQLRFRGRIFQGTPSSASASHTGPVFPSALRRGAITASEIESIWDRPGGPRLTDLFDTGSNPADRFWFLINQAGPNDYRGPADTGTLRWFYNGSGERWGSFAQQRPVIVYRDGARDDDASTITPTPVFEPGLAWSGFWQQAPPDDALRLDIEPSAGGLPGLRSVLSGTRDAAHALTAWGLGNSRWANTSDTPRSISDTVTIGRSHLLGLREARSEIDGGIVLLNTATASNIEGVDIVSAPSSGNDLFTNWTRFAYGGSFAASPGTGAPVHIDPAGQLVFRVRAGHPSEPTQSVALLLERPRGGRATAELYLADALGAGGTVASGRPLPGTPPFADGAPGRIDTDTTRATVMIEELIDGAVSQAVRVSGDAQLVQAGDAVVGEDDGVVNVVAQVRGDVIEMRFPWTTVPQVGETLAAGPYGVRLVGYEYAGLSSTFISRGLRIGNAGGGRVTLVGIGIRDTNPNRICYVLAGRGGLGQQQQADAEAPGTLAMTADALGTELFFTGLATQSAGTIPALIQQLGDRIETHEFIGTPDVINAQSNTFGSQTAAQTHREIAAAAEVRDNWAYLQIQDEFPAMLDQFMALQRHDPVHPNGRAMIKAADMWWTKLETTPALLRTPCRPDVNNDGLLTPADFTAWITAFNAKSPACDQNGDGQCTPADFTAWVTGFNTGCDE
ncbi:MAG: GC-type dockerin domain-anchored protein [Planctomycetota bacterium]